MADIVIRGMAMPKDNDATSIIIFSNGKVSLAHDKKYAEYAEAVPLPEGHGRLIDADACHSPEDLNNEPTIVPAEGGTDGMIISELHLEEEPKPHKCSCGTTPRCIYNGLLWTVECPTCFYFESGWSALGTINAWNKRVDEEGGGEDG